MQQINSFLKNCSKICFTSVSLKQLFYRFVEFRILEWKNNRAPIGPYCAFVCPSILFFSDQINFNLIPTTSVNSPIVLCKFQASSLMQYGEKYCTSYILTHLSKLIRYLPIHLLFLNWLFFSTSKQTSSFERIKTILWKSQKQQHLKIIPYCMKVKVFLCSAPRSHLFPNLCFYGWVDKEVLLYIAFTNFWRVPAPCLFKISKSPKSISLVA